MNNHFQPVRNSQEHQAALERLEVYLGRLHFVDRFLADEIRLQAVVRAEIRASGLSSMPIVEEGLKLVDHWFVDSLRPSEADRGPVRLRLVLDPAKLPEVFKALHPEAYFREFVADMPGRFEVCPPLIVSRMTTVRDRGGPSGRLVPSIVGVLLAIFGGLLGWMFVIR